MSCERCRIKEAQDNLYKWCLNNLPAGRKVKQEDEEGIARVRKSNLKAREKLFGSKEYVWYLKYKEHGYDCR